VRVHHWRDGAIVAGAVAIFVGLAIGTQRPPIAMNAGWMVALAVAMLGMLGACGWLLWKRTRFS